MKCKNKHRTAGELTVNLARHRSRAQQVRPRTSTVPVSNSYPTAIDKMSRYNSEVEDDSSKRERGDEVVNKLESEGCP